MLILSNGLRQHLAIRLVKPLWSKFGTMIGIPLGGFDMWCNELFGFSLFGTLKHGKPDHATLKTLAESGNQGQSDISRMESWSIACLSARFAKGEVMTEIMDLLRVAQGERDKV